MAQRAAQIRDGVSRYRDSVAKLKMAADQANARAYSANDLVRQATEDATNGEPGAEQRLADALAQQERVHTENEAAIQAASADTGRSLSGVFGKR